METTLSFIGTLLCLMVVGTKLWVGLDASRLMSGIPNAKRAEIARAVQTEVKRTPRASVVWKDSGKRFSGF